MSGLVEQLDPNAVQGNGPTEGRDKREGAIHRTKLQPGRSNSRTPMKDMLASGLPKATKGAGPIGAGCKQCLSGQGTGGETAHGRRAAREGSKEASQHQPLPTRGAWRQLEHQARPGKPSAGVVQRHSGLGQKQEEQRQGKEARAAAERAPARPRRQPAKTLVA